MSAAEMKLAVTPTSQQLDLPVFNSLFSAGLVLLAIVILPPLFCSKVRRSALWFAFMGYWMLYCASCLLLVGHQIGPDPPFGLCLLQAVLIHAVSTLATIAGVCFVVDLYCVLRITIMHSYWIPLKRTAVLLALPLVSFLSLFILSLVIGLLDHSTVDREPSGLVCHINTGLPTLVSAILSGWSLVIALAVEVSAAFVIYGARTKSPDALPIAKGMLIRISMFSVVTLLGLIVSAFQLFHFLETGLKSNILIPLLPILIAIIFGVQRDIIGFWKHERFETKADPVEPV
ncbi:hypothetical protein B0H13DRAFT_2684413 [Mycena leptocephala]|nr:hypothetical protein B0H13DRAFT_2684413 [Mycena leptocephala]